MYKQSTLHEIHSGHKGKVSDNWAIYLATYERILSGFREKPIHLFEIGIQNGGSLEIWAKYFSNASIISGSERSPAARMLTYSDARVHIFTGDANTEEQSLAIQLVSPQMDIVIDNGTHLPSDVIGTFFRYFPMLEDGGIYVVAGLHCSYWQETQGGLYDPTSVVSFFKCFADIVNAEHWGNSKQRSDLLIDLQEKYNFKATDALLAQIHSVEFVNSMCVIRKQAVQKNMLGSRLVVGEEEPVFAGHRKYNSTTIVPPDQLSNPYSKTSSAIQVGTDRLTQLDAFDAGMIFTFWLGPYVMSPSRTTALQSIFRDSGRPVTFITDATLANFEHPVHPFHAGFKYLSEVHKADYLRCYLMHHYGGGYTDIKPVLQPWGPHFRTLEASNCLALGYPEISAGAVAQLPGELGDELRAHYAELIGYCSMIFRKKTVLTHDWIAATHEKLDAILPLLVANPARHPMDQRGVQLPDGSTSTYPLKWTELGGNIFHPIILKYRNLVMKVQGIVPQLHDYR